VKVVINKCHGGFGLSHEAVMAYAERKGMKLYPEDREHFALMGPTYFRVPPEERKWSDSGPAWCALTPEQKAENNALYDAEHFHPRDIERTDADLVAVVEAMGAASSGRFSELAVVEIPDDVEWKIEEYDGAEWVAEKHRTWS
jgi:hypothetical protein